MENSVAYTSLVERLNRFPQGAPASPSLYAILRLLFSEQEAGLVARLPIQPFRAATAARIWGIGAVEARELLDGLAGRAMLLDVDNGGEPEYCLPPPMAGFFEFSLMRVRGDLDQKALAELFHQYLNVEEDFVRDLFTGTETPLGRIFPDETVLDRPREAAPGVPLAASRMEVLDYERMSHIVRTATHRGISLCYCRHKMRLVGKGCAAPLDICMTFNTSAASLIKHGHARAVSEGACLDLMEQARDAGLVHFGENTRRGVNFICNCCGCCCEALLAVRRFAVARTIHSNFIARLSPRCRDCGRCVTICPVQAIERLPAEAPASSADLHTSPAPTSLTSSSSAASSPCGPRLRVLEDRCLGCGVCVRACSCRGIELEPRPARVITPLNTAHRVVLMATEKGMLRELLEDNHAPGAHRIMAAVIGSLLKAPGPLRDFAVRQLKSRYLENLFAKLG